MKRYYSCEELNENGKLWSYRENTDEELMLVLIDENAKSFILMNSAYVDIELQKEVSNKLTDMGYVIKGTKLINKFLKG